MLRRYSINEQEFVCTKIALSSYQTATQVIFYILIYDAVHCCDFLVWFVLLPTFLAMLRVWRYHVWGERCLAKTDSSRSACCLCIVWSGQVCYAQQYWHHPWKGPSLTSSFQLHCEYDGKSIIKLSYIQCSSQSTFIYIWWQTVCCLLLVGSQ